jgi:hypothetical protein
MKLNLVVKPSAMVNREPFATSCAVSLHLNSTFMETYSASTYIV